MNTQEPDYKRLFLAIFLAGFVLLSWQAMVEWPRRQQLAHYAVEQAKKRAEIQEKRAEAMPVKDSENEDNPNLTRSQRLGVSPRITIQSDRLHGSISLKGARFDDLTLARYRETLDPTSPEVTLFAPNGDEEAYFAQIGWVSQDGKTKVPDQHTLWQADKKSLQANDKVTLHWNNGEGVTYTLTIALDSDYMFSVAQHVENHSGHAVNVTPYAYINRAYSDAAAESSAKQEHPKHSTHPANTSGLHEGPIGVMQDALTEVTYKELHDKGNKTYEDASGWFGITDKYWLSALIPAEHYKATFSHYVKGDMPRYQVDYLGQPQDIATGASGDYHVRLFAGAKEIKTLDRYAAGNAANNEAPIPLFDRAVDFGMLYFLTKPMCLLLNYFYAQAGNFGIAIMLLTVVVKLLLFPLANKSYKAASQMRTLQPEILKLRERYFDDQITLQKETMALYKSKKINPASGCLPIIPQMIVFIALLKVLNVTIEMRHAPFFGWIRDLSAADPSNLFTLFGLVPWATPPFLHIALLPILYSITMAITMMQQPTPPDPTSARVMKMMPLFLLFVFNSMPAGLVVYWIWSNSITIVQQFIMIKRHGSMKTPLPPKAAANA